jgi:hypothetical protein
MNLLYRLLCLLCTPRCRIVSSSSIVGAFVRRLLLLLRMYPIIRVLANAPEATEPLGTKDKFWYDAGRLMFKQVRPGTGEDWAEKVSAELARRFGLPLAEYDLAQWETAGGYVRGVCSRLLSRGNGPHSWKRTSGRG